MKLIILKVDGIAPTSNLHLYEMISSIEVINVKVISNIYSNSKLPLSPVIRYMTKSEFSHVAIILEREASEITKDSLVTHSALSSKGVRFTTLKTFISHATNYRVTELNVEIDDHKFYLLNAFARMYEGTPYDLKGAIGLGGR